MVIAASRHRERRLCVRPDQDGVGDVAVDMLVKLYDLPRAERPIRIDPTREVQVRRAMAYEKAAVVAWVNRAFGADAPGWVSECEVAFSRSPIACHIAVGEAAVVGFACHDTTAKNVVGPIGVDETLRRAGIGRSLLLSVLQAMRADGYGYAVIGQVGVPEFFTKAVGAMDIPDSSPGLYPDPLNRTPVEPPGG